MWINFRDQGRNWCWISGSRMSIARDYETATTVSIKAQINTCNAACETQIGSMSIRSLAVSPEPVLRPHCSSYSLL